MGVLYAYYVRSLLAHFGNDSGQQTISPAVCKMASGSGSDSSFVRPAVGRSQRPVDSGLWMARYAEAGAIAGTGFAALAVVTGICVALGWRSVVTRRFAEHQRWMLRCFILLCSAVVLRVIGGLTIVTGVESEWSYPLAAWTSWLLPLMAYEVIRFANWRAVRRQPTGTPAIDASAPVTPNS